MDASLRAVKSPVPLLSCKPLEASSSDPVRSLAQVCLHYGCWLILKFC